MIGAVVATHGKLAEEMIRTAETVVGKLEKVEPVSIVATAPDVRGDLKAAIQRVDSGEGVLLLTDLLGGSSTNLCLSFLTERRVEVVTGVNLAMLIKLSGLRASGKPILEVARTLLLLRDVRDAVALHEQGVPMPKLNLGNIHFRAGRKQVAPSVFLGGDELAALERLASEGTEVEVRAVPGEPALPLAEIKQRFRV